MSYVPALENNVNLINANSLPNRDQPTVWQRVCKVIQTIFEIAILTVAIATNPTIVGTITIISFFAARKVYPILKNDFVGVFKEHPVYMTIGTIWIGLIVPHFILLAASTLTCAYFASRYNYHRHPPEEDRRTV